MNIYSLIWYIIYSSLMWKHCNILQKVTQMLHYDDARK